MQRVFKLQDCKRPVALLATNSMYPVQSKFEDGLPCSLSTKYTSLGAAARPCQKLSGCSSILAAICARTSVTQSSAFCAPSSHLLHRDDRRCKRPHFRSPQCERMHKVCTDPRRARRILKIASKSSLVLTLPSPPCPAVTALQARTPWATVQATALIVRQVMVLMLLRLDSGSVARSPVPWTQSCQSRLS